MTDDTAPPEVQEVEDTLETQEPTVAVGRDQMGEVHDAATTLMNAVAKLPGGDQINEMLVTSLKLLRDNNNRADLKLINTSLKELRYALKIFEPYKEVRKISIFGSARTPEDAGDYIAAVEYGKKIADLGWMVITGAGGGIMAAGHGGAGAKPSFGLAIRLPFEQKTNEFIEGDPKLINFKYFFTRKLMFVRSSHAVAVFPGGFGTMDEGFEVLTLIQTGKAPLMPIVFIDAPGSNFWAGWEHNVKDQLLGQPADQPRGREPVQAHTERRRRHRRGDEVLQQLPQHALRARHAGHPREAGAVAGADRRDQSPLRQDLPERADRNARRIAAGKRRAEPHRFAAGHAAIQPQGSRQSPVAGQLSERRSLTAGSV